MSLTASELKVRPHFKGIPSKPAGECVAVTLLQSSAVQGSTGRLACKGRPGRSRCDFEVT